MSQASPRVLALCGGVGGAKLVLGLSHIVAGEDLMVVVNTGDDFDHLGLRVCPDIDTVSYTLAGVVNPETGWGRAGETGEFMAALASLGGEDWFFLGDRDLALHVERTRRLRDGETLSDITADFACRLGVTVNIVPMSDDPVATKVATKEGELAFQHYFVRERCQPAVTGFRFQGIDRASPHSRIVEALQNPALEAVVICPSNPFVSIDPILALPGLREALTRCTAPVVAISPIVGGAAVKGPTAKMMAELNVAVTPAAVVTHYAGLLEGFVLDERDATWKRTIERLVPHVSIGDTLMVNLDRKIALAEQVLALAGRCVAA